MRPAIQTGQVDVYFGDNRLLLPTLETGIAHTCVTSPPYWGLRDYGTAQWEGGDPEHKHDGYKPTPGRTSQRSGRSHQQGHVAVACDCGAVRVADDQAGLEPTLEEYVDNLVGVFREVRRILRPDGTLWLVLGDSYAGGSGPFSPQSAQVGKMVEHREKRPAQREIPPGLKPKDLIGVPWRVAFALQADGWYLRSAIIWHKPNAMPDSTEDRPSPAHEYIFLLSANERYLYNAHLIAEPARSTAWPGVGPQHARARARGERYKPMKAHPTRNRRDVWSIATEPYPDAHFAVFPRRLAELCILGGAPLGGLVLDPFAGSGTVGEVAQQRRRRALLIELNPDYEPLLMRRLGVMPKVKREVRNAG